MMLHSTEYRQELIRHALQQAEDWEAWPFRQADPPPERLYSGAGGETTLMHLMELAQYAYAVADDLYRLAAVALNNHTCGVPFIPDEEWQMIGSGLRRLAWCNRRMRSDWKRAEAKWLQADRHRDYSRQPKPGVRSDPRHNGQGSLEETAQDVPF